MEPTRIDEQYREILEYPYWLHRIPLGDGRFTPGFKTLDWDALGLPDRLDGSTFLEAGASDGMYAFEAERRGADRVLATDVWDDPRVDSEWWAQVHSGKESFDRCREYLDSDVESEVVPVEELSPESVGTFDVVLCSDVLMHVPEPYTAIERLVSVADEQVVVKSPVTRVADDRPVMEFTKLDPDRWNWWLPNLSCLAAMTEAAGCTETRSFYPPSNPDEAASVDPVRDGRLVDRPVSLYRDVERTEQVGTLSPGQRVVVLYDGDDLDSVRVHSPGDPEEFGGEEGPRWTARTPTQGWVAADAVEVGARRSVLTRGLDVLRTDGVAAFLAEASSFVRERAGADSAASHGVVHGRVPPRGGAAGP